MTEPADDYRRICDLLSRDGMMDASTAMHCMRLLGFDVEYAEPVSCEAVVADAASFEMNVAKRTFSLMASQKKWVTQHELHAFLTSLGLRVSDEHAEHLTELISKDGSDAFSEPELVAFMLPARRRDRTPHHTGKIAS